MSTLKFENAFYLPSGRIFMLSTKDGYKIECTEMRDVAVGSKQHLEVRTSMDPHVIWKHLVPYQEKLLLTVSTQRGCVHSCQFCDVSPLPFKGNLTQEEIQDQVKFLLKSLPYVKQCDKAKIGFARMGEPAHNLDNVLGAMGNLKYLSKKKNKKFRWLPCFNTILPINCLHSPEKVLDAVIDFKERCYDGFLHLQISCNSTDEDKRQELFGGSPVMTIEDIIAYVRKQEITERTVTMNFIVMEGVEVDVKKLKKMGMTGDMFTVKLIPLNRTIKGDSHNLKALANYNNYEELEKLGREFEAEGIPTVIDAIAKCEEAGLCCGQLAQIFQEKDI